MSEIVGLITARGGSKSIPRKNLKMLAGKPLIAWTIEAALQSPSLDRVIVSTDDVEIAEVSRQWGAEVPFIRPAELAQDDSSHVSVVVHTVRWLESYQGTRPNYLVLLQPTSPLRTAEDIEAAVQVAFKKKADSVVSVSETHHHPYLMKRIMEDGILADFMSGVPQPGSRSIRRQDLPPVYSVNGAIYLTQCELLLNSQTLLSPRTFPYIMPPQRSLQVDDLWDFYLIHLIMEHKDGFSSIR